MRIGLTCLYKINPKFVRNEKNQGTKEKKKKTKIKNDYTSSPE